MEFNFVVAGKGAVAVAAGVLAWLFGPWDPLIAVLLALVAIDYVSGVASAAARRELSSAQGFRGLVKKIGIFAIVAVASLADRVVPAANGALRSAACAFYIANEGLSVLENWGNIGLPLPDVLKKALAQLKDKKEE